MIIAILSFAMTQTYGTKLELKSATTHPMKFYISLPESWNASQKWPVILAIPGAERDFEETASKFVNARGHKPYIIVVPMVVTNGGSRYREATSYRYDEKTWDDIKSVGEYRFDLPGITAVLADVRTRYSGERRVYVTGFEAGGHTLFALTFRHSELLSAVVPIAPNYQARGVDELVTSAVPHIPIHEMHGSEDPYSAPDKPFWAQWQRASADAKARGFNNISSEVVKGQGHVWLAADVIRYFDSIRSKTKN